METTCNSSGLLTTGGGSQEGFLLRDVQTASAHPAIKENFGLAGLILLGLLVNRS